MTETYRLQGALGSPFSLKMRAVLRHRRLPHLWIAGQEGFAAAQRMRAKVIPVLTLPDGTDANDSTSLIALLEDRHADRSLTPTDPAAAFLALLVEDMADEWFARAMFAYRWTRSVDQEQMGRWLAFDVMRGGGEAAIAATGAAFRDRQVSRLPLAGAGADVVPEIEASASRIMAALDAHVVNRPYLFGSRPSAAEFALYGQLSQLATDPTPQALMRERWPWLYRWLAHIDDLSGEPEGYWAGLDVEAPALTVLLTECGACHLPLLLANEAAAVAGQTQFTCRIGAVEATQAVNRYQIKCLTALRDAWRALPTEARDRLRPPLEAADALSALEPKGAAA